MTEKKLQVGFVPVARSTFDMTLAAEVIDNARRRLEGDGMVLKGPAAPVATASEATAAAGDLAGETLDVLVVFQATFADSNMALSLAESIDAPLLLWALPEAPSGDRLRLNSYCGVNLGAHALTRRSILYEAMYLSPDDPAALERIRALALAGRIRRQLRGARIGRFGPEPDGFPTCVLDEEGLKKHLGVEVVQFELGNLFEEVKNLGAGEVQAVWDELSPNVAGLEDVEPAAAKRTLATYLVLRKLLEKRKLDAFAVRCWPEFFTELGCAACGALSLLSDELVPASCESDVNGVITQLILQSAAEAPVFDTDIVAYDSKLDGVVLWHCGKAPLSMADPAVTPRATIHSNRKLPLLWEFPLRPGPITFVRLSAATGEFRLVLGKAEMVRAEKGFSGTYGVCRFDRPAQQVMERILEQGLEHHIALAYGDFVPTLKALARLLKIPILEL